MDLWYLVSPEFSDYELLLVPFEENCDGILFEIAQLGMSFDFLQAVCEAKLRLDQYHMLPLRLLQK